MPATGHKHKMEVIAWTTGSPYRPAVLLGCRGGVCSKTENCIPNKRKRKVPEGLTAEQFEGLKAGRFWPEIVQA